MKATGERRMYSFVFHYEFLLLSGQKTDDCSFWQWCLLFAVYYKQTTLHLVSRSLITPADFYGHIQRQVYLSYSNNHNNRNASQGSSSLKHTPKMLIWALRQFHDNRFIHLVIWKKAEGEWQIQKTSITIAEDWKRQLSSRFWLNHYDSVNFGS